MGLRFRKTLNILPGVRLNISKSGVSASVGEKGFTYNIGEKGTRTTVGLPGSGLSYSSNDSYRGKSIGGKLIWIMIMLLVVGVVTALRG